MSAAGGAGGAYADRSLRVQCVWLWVCGWCVCVRKCERAERADGVGGVSARSVLMVWVVRVHPECACAACGWCGWCAYIQSVRVQLVCVVRARKRAERAGCFVRLGVVRVQIVDKCRRTARTRGTRTRGSTGAGTKTRVLILITENALSARI